MYYYFEFFLHLVKPSFQVDYFWETIILGLIGTCVTFGLKGLLVFFLLVFLYFFMPSVKNASLSDKGLITFKS